jgi:hypothetical protein
MKSLFWFMWISQTYSPFMCRKGLAHFQPAWMPLMPSVQRVEQLELLEEFSPFS